MAISPIPELVAELAAGRMIVLLPRPLARRLIATP